MKFNLNITDMNEEEFAKLFASINVPAANISVVPETDTTRETWNMPKTDTSEVDNDGLHWDARIHSSNHQMTAKGVWQRRRGISDEEFNKVKNELLGIQEPVTPAEPEIVPPVTVAQTPMGEYSTLAPVVAPAPIPAPVAPVAPEPVQAPAAPVIDSAVLYQTMFEKIKVGLNNGKFKANDVQNLVTAINAQFGTQYQSLYLIKDNIDALQFVINDLTTRGL